MTGKKSKSEGVDRATVKKALMKLYVAREDRPKGRGINDKYCAVEPVKEAADILSDALED